MEALPPEADFLTESSDIAGGDGENNDNDLPSFGQGCGSSPGSVASSPVTTFIGGRLGMMAGLKSSACNSECFVRQNCD